MRLNSVERDAVRLAAINPTVEFEMVVRLMAVLPVDSSYTPA